MAGQVAAVRQWVARVDQRSIIKVSALPAGETKAAAAQAVLIAEQRAEQVKPRR
jgi:hypothetical protein